MKTVIIGESFTKSRDTEKKRNETYAWYLQQTQNNIDILAFPGSGNDLLSYVALSEIDNYDRFIINWTSTCRYDMMVNDKTKFEFYRGRCDDHLYKENLFVCSGGWRAYWNEQPTKHLFHAMYKYHFDIENSWRTSLQNILAVHQLLEKKNKTHINFFSYDTFENQSFGAYEKKYKKLYNKKRWENFKIKNNWINNINWNAVWFHKNNFTNTGGILDWCHDNTDDDWHHPSGYAAKEFATKIIVPWLEQTN